MKIVFFGTPAYVVPVIHEIHKRFVTGPGKSPIVAVVTQSPKPVGRKKYRQFSPIDEWAHDRNIPVFYSSREILKSDIEADLGILASFGEIIPKEVLNLFPHGILNIHPSLLPKFRGASPVQAAIASGEKTTGATIIKLDEKLDHGPIITQFKEDILHSDTTETLRNRLFERSADVLSELLTPYIKGKVRPKPQDDTKATFTILVKKEHAFIKPKLLNAALQGKSIKDELEISFIKNCSLVPSAYSLEQFIRAMQPWPVAWTHVSLRGNSLQATAQKRIKLLKSHTEDSSPSAVSLVLDTVQLEGKNPVSWGQFKDAYPESVFYEADTEE